MWVNEYVYEISEKFEESNPRIPREFIRKSKRMVETPKQEDEMDERLFTKRC